MIDYDRTAWWHTCFRFSGTVLPHILDRVGLFTGFCLFLCLLDEFVFEPSGYPMPAFDPLGHTVLGVAMSLLIVIRTNTSMGRYWDGRSAWGAMVNCSRNLARMGAVYVGQAEDLARLITAYVISVKENLRGHRDLTEVRHLIPGRIFERIAAASNPPSLLSASLSEWIHQHLVNGKIDVIQATQMEAMVSGLVDAQGACEKIQKTPLPFTYAALIKQLLMLYLGSLPFVLVAKMGFAAPAVIAVVSLGMLGIEEAGVEIEDPFGLNPNHLPLDRICETIGRDTVALAESHRA